MRTVTITEDENGMVASDEDGQFAIALPNPNKKTIVYVSFLHGDIEPVVAENKYARNWRQNVLELIGF